MVKKEVFNYLENVNHFLEADLNDTETLVRLVTETEPENRIVVDASGKGLKLGMVFWDFPKVQAALAEIKQAISDVLDSIAEHGKVGAEALEKLNKRSHDLKIQHIPAPDSSAGWKLGYVVPDSKIAWEEGKCPHCGEMVTIHIFPDPIPIFAYEAIINTLRLISRNIVVSKGDAGTFVIREN